MSPLAQAALIVALDLPLKSLAFLQVGVLQTRHGGTLIGDSVGLERRLTPTPIRLGGGYYGIHENYGNGPQNNDEYTR